MKKLVLAAAALAVLPILLVKAMGLPELEAPVSIFEGPAATIYVFETLRLV